MDRLCLWLKCSLCSVGGLCVCLFVSSCLCTGMYLVSMCKRICLYGQIVFMAEVFVVFCWGPVCVLVCELMPVYRYVPGIYV